MPGRDDQHRGAPGAGARIRVADEAGVDAAVAALRAGQLIGLPTETVYGLAGRALDPEVVGRIFAAKGRPADNPLIVHLADAAALEPLVTTVTPLARGLAAAHWPGPLTLVLTASPHVPAITRGGLTTVAVRVPDHPVALTVVQLLGHPVAAPSANRSSRPSPTRPEHVLEEVGDHLALVLDGGPCAIGVESTVVDARGDRPIVLREGAVTREQLGVSGEAGAAERERSPGTRYRHYAPRCRIEIVDSGGLGRAVARCRRTGAQVGVLAARTSLVSLDPSVEVVGAFDDEVELARALYGAFVDAERAQVDVLLVEAVPERGVGRAVMDRLRRAAE